jgi:HK97 family phage major capsid protein
MSGAYGYLEAITMEFKDWQAGIGAELAGESGGGSVWEGGEGSTVGERFTSSAPYKALLERGMSGSWSTGPVKLAGPFEAKTLLTEQAGSGVALVQPDVQAGILPLLFRRLTIAGLIPQGRTANMTVRYLSETTFTNAAAPTAEGALKPESAEVFAQTDEPVRKIAHFLPVTEEMLADAPALQGFINARLTLGVQLTEEDQLLNGNGTSPNLLGFLNRSGLAAAQPRGTDNNADAIFKQVSAIRKNAFVEPDGIVIHPDNWQTIRLAKDAQGQYYGRGPFEDTPGQTTLWGIRVVVTPAISAGTALVGAFQPGSQIFRRTGMELAASNSHSDFFQRNQVALRAEERLALAVYRPSGFGTVTGLN